VIAVSTAEEQATGLATVHPLRAAEDVEEVEEDEEVAMEATGVEDTEAITMEVIAEEGVASVEEGEEEDVVEVVVWRLSGVITAGKAVISQGIAPTMTMNS